MRRACLKTVLLMLLLLSDAASAATANLPCVEGQEEAGAISVLQAAGFGYVATTGQFSDVVSAGLIISESPACGGQVDTSSQINLVCSLGSVQAAGNTVFGTAFNGIMHAFALGIFAGLFIKITNRS